MRDLGEILAGVRKRIDDACARVGRDPREVEIIAVTKTHGEDTVREAWEAGLGIIGENKVQEAMWKREASPSGPSWHLIGHLQGNKVRNALATFDFIHSVDSLRLADRIEAVSESYGFNPHILFEINVSGERSKSGMKPADAEAAIVHVMKHCPRISVEGLMTMAPFSENREDARPYFRALRELRDRLERDLGIGLPRLSMGMSGDYETAVEEGATWVRLGTVLFGERPKACRRRAVSDGDEMDFGLDSYSSGPVVKIYD